MLLFPIAIIQQDGLYYGRLPDLPDLEISASSMIDILSLARTNVIHHLQDYVERDLPIPEGSDISTHLSKAEFAGWTWAIVNIDSSKILGDCVTVPVNISRRLVQRINLYLADTQQATDLEHFLIQAAKDKVDKLN